MRRPWVVGARSAPPSCSRSRSRRCRSRSATARCASSRQGNETRVGAELAAQKAGPGAAGPIQVIAELDDGRATDHANRAALARYADELRRDPEVAQVAAAEPSRDGARR